MNNHIAVLGSGTMGTALANAVASKGNRCTLWSHDPAIVGEINDNHRNCRHFSGQTLPSTLIASSSIEETVRSAGFVLVAIASARFRQILMSAQPFVDRGVPIFSATKALESGTHKSMSEIIAEIFTGCVPGALSGPNIAHDIIGRFPTGIVAASECSEAISMACDALQTPALRIFASSDLRGVELAGALKNVVAIAAGLTGGLSLGDNARSLIVALGLLEIQALGTRLGAQADTFIGLAGLGDLFLTSTSINSRNHMVGVELGKGKQLSQILADLERLDETAEGINTVRACRQLAIRTGTPMPVAEAVYEVIFEAREPRAAFERLFKNPDLGCSPKAAESRNANSVRSGTLGNSGGPIQGHCVPASDDAA